jgi:hypothetical protein
MKRFLEFLAEAIHPSDIATLRDDAGAFTKDARRIASGTDLKTVSEAWERWEKYVYDFIYNRLLGINDAGHIDETKESYESKQLRVKWWNIHVLGNVFIDHWRGYTRDMGPADWDSCFASFQTNRDKVYSKLGRIIREGFKALDEYMAKYPEGHPDRAVTDHTSVGGVPVTIITSELQKNDFDPRTVLGFISTVVNRVKEVGLSRYLADVRYLLMATTTSFDVAGNYLHQRGESEIRIFGWGNTLHTVAHELGHHVYYQLSSRAQKYWSDFVTSNRLSFTDEELTDIHDAYDRCFHALVHSANYLHTVDVWGHLVDYITNPNAATKFKHFMAFYGKKNRQRVLMDPFTDGSDLNAKFDDFKKEAGVFMMFAPSAYANKNSDEAFCEVWADYITQEHPLADIVQAVFEDAVGLH